MRSRRLWDKPGTGFYDLDFLDFSRLRDLDAGSIPAASTNFSGTKKPHDFKGFRFPSRCSEPIVPSEGL